MGFFSIKPKDVPGPGVGGGPYREMPMSDHGSDVPKYPRLITTCGKHRLIRISTTVTVVEEPVSHVDALGVRHESWTRTLTRKFPADHGELFKYHERPTLEVYDFLVSALEHLTS